MYYCKNCGKEITQWHGFWVHAGVLSHCHTKSNGDALSVWLAEPDAE